MRHLLPASQQALPPVSAAIVSATAHLRPARQAHAGASPFSAVVAGLGCETVVSGFEITVTQSDIEYSTEFPWSVCDNESAAHKSAAPLGASAAAP